MEDCGLGSDAAIDKLFFTRAPIQFTADPGGVRVGFLRNGIELKS